MTHIQAEENPFRTESWVRKVLTFWLPVVVLLALALTLPWAATTTFGLNERTPLALAEDALNHKYGLELVDGAGNPLPKDSIDLTASTFDMEPGSTTTDVPFRLDGRLVHCTVHMPTGDPDDVTAECR